MRTSHRDRDLPTYPPLDPELRYRYSGPSRPGLIWRREPAPKKHFLQIFGVFVLSVFCLVLLFATGYSVYRLAAQSPLLTPPPGVTETITPIPLPTPAPQLTTVTPGPTPIPAPLRDLQPDAALSIADTPDPTPIPTPVPGRPLTIPQICQKLEPSLVGIKTTKENGYSEASGVIMTANGYLITNHHVIEGATEITVIDCNGVEYTPLLVGSDEATDLAVLKLNAQNLIPAEFGDSDKLRVGESVVVMGNPSGLELYGSFSSGIVSSLDRTLTVGNYNMTLIQTDAAMSPGVSGGALVNQYGQVIGINNLKVSGSNYEGLGFSIPSQQVKKIVDSLIRYGVVAGRPMLSIIGGTLDSAHAEAIGLSGGILVTEVVEGSSAYQNGLQPGDVIYEFNGTICPNMAVLFDLKNACSPGDTAILSVYRNGHLLSIPVVLADSAVPVE